MSKPKPKRTCPKCDRLGTKEDGLKWTWKWPIWEWDNSPGQMCWHGGPGYQIASAEETIDVECKQTVTLECIEWAGGNDGHSYEGRVSLCGNEMCSSRISFEDGFATRIEAQRAAEEMVMKLGYCLYTLNRNFGN